MTTPAPTVTDHDDFERQLLELRKREKAHTREGDAIAAARRRLPMTEVPPDTTVIGPDGPVPFGDVFEGRDELVVYSHMFYDGKPWEWQCEGCTRNSWPMQDAADAAYLNANGITFAILGDGPYEEIAAFRDFMGYTAPWYSNAHLDDPTVGVAGRISCYLRREDKIYLTYWTTGRGDEVMTSLVRAARHDRLRAAGGVGGLARGVAAVPDPLLLAHRRARCADGAQKRRSTGAPVDAPGRHRGRRTNRVALPSALRIRWRRIKRIRGRCSRAVSRQTCARGSSRSWRSAIRSSPIASATGCRRSCRAGGAGVPLVRRTRRCGDSTASSAARRRASRVRRRARGHRG